MSFDRILLSIALLLPFARLATGAISFTGDVIPHPNTVNSSQELYIGRTADGSVQIDGGSSIDSGISFIGYEAGVTGAVMITGDGSTWNTQRLTVGERGNGELSITGGANLTNSSFSIIGSESSGSGKVTITGANSSWINGNALTVGWNGHGELTIADGGTVSNANSSIGSIRGAKVTVTGTGSIWVNSGNLRVGESGTGMLAITNGGLVDVADATYVERLRAPFLGGVGTISFDNGILKTRSLLASNTQLEGAGTIHTHGLVSDIDLVFDLDHAVQQQIVLEDRPNQNIVIHLDADGTGLIGAGYTADGSLSIIDGIAVQSTGGYVGYRPGSFGLATVKGPGSTWANSGELIVASGNLTISDGGLVSNTVGTIGRYPMSVGNVTVTGHGSAWTNSGRLTVGGGFGTGELTIADGALVTSTSARIGQPPGQGVVKITGKGSTWINSEALEGNRASHDRGWRRGFERDGPNRLAFR